MLDVIIAAIAGLVSFISPCVLPLVPAYIGYMGGRMTHTVSTQVSVSSGGSGGSAAAVDSRPASMRFSTFLHGGAFVLGFTAVFVVLGLLGTAFVRQFGSTNVIEGVIGRVGGVLIIFFGLHFMGVLPAMFARMRRQPDIFFNIVTSIVVAVAGTALIAWAFSGTVALWDTSAYVGWTGALALAMIAVFLLLLIFGGAFAHPGAFWNRSINTIDMALYADTRREMDVGAKKGLPGSALMGVVFAAGWTPCIGPTLGLAMTMAANGGDIGQAAVLMTAYSLGLGIPFLLTALMLDSAQGVLRGLKSHMGTIKMVSGAFLVVIGVTIASGRLQDLSQRFSVQFGDFSYRVEQCTVGLVEGDIGFNQYGTCFTGDESFESLKANNIAPVIESDETPAQSSESSSVDTSSSQSIEEAAEEAGPGVGLAVGDVAPDFQTTTLSGEEVSLSDFRGQVVLLNFWFTTCAPCRIEMPDLQSVYNAYRDDGFTILAINREEGPETIREFVNELGLSFPILLDQEGDIQYRYDISGYPRTFIVDENGVIVFRSFGLMTEEQVDSLVQDTLS